MPAAVAPERPRRIAMLIYPGVTPLDVAGPLQVFELGNILSGRALYDIATVAPQAGPVPAAAGITFLPTLAMHALALPVDTLLVSGATDPEAGVSPETLAWLRHAGPQARRFGSICTGAFVLAAAGMIEGRRVTTHWEFAPRLAVLAPKTRVEVDPIFVRDGSLYSSAGITAGIDLALALLEDDHGRALALAVARTLVLFLKRSGGQEQFSTHLQAQMSELPVLQRVQEWCLTNLAGDLSVAALARRASMSERSFARLFRRETGSTPGGYVGSLRLKAARRLLEETALPAADVAKRCGLSPTALRRTFRRQLGVGPTEYRTSFSRV